MILDYAKLGFTNLLQRKLRTLLTVIGIFIGIASIVSLLLISDGLENAITDQFEQLGTNKIFVFPANFQGNLVNGLNTKDVEAIESITEVDYVVGILGEAAILEYQNEKVARPVYGWPTDLPEEVFGDFDLTPSDGKWFTTPSDQAVIGSLVATDMFDSEIRINNRIIINDKKFTVVGILESFGNPEDDNSVYIPMESARELFDEPEAVSFIQINVKEGVDVNNVADKVQSRLERIRSEESFDVSTAEQFLDQLGDILGIVNSILVGIAAIALLVGAIGIANSMYTAVAERTSDIGVMKSLGATNNQILSLFLIESFYLGILGGVLGIITGAGIAYAVAVAAKAAGYDLLKIVIGPVIIAIGMSIAVGTAVVSGVLPARQASKLKPVEAMRKK